jgi:8-amino-7-oxononanoate synthase
MTHVPDYDKAAKLAAMSLGSIREAVGRGLMHEAVSARLPARSLLLSSGWSAVDFLTCSYLGLDTHPQIMRAAMQAVHDWGVGLTCARSRLSIQPLAALEGRLSALFGGRAVAFPSVTSAHVSTLPLVAARCLWNNTPEGGRDVHFVFDKFAHASMQLLKPVLAATSEVTTIPHNDLDQLTALAEAARRDRRSLVYVADSIYSMGGTCPLEEILELSAKHHFSLYIDDAHGTSIYGARGEGFVMGTLSRALPPNMIITFSLAKGFGCNGGGVLLPTEADEQVVRYFGQTYAFSAPLDNSIVGAALASVGMHESGAIVPLQAQLRANCRQFDEYFGIPTGRHFSPIRMVHAPSNEECIAIAGSLLDKGYLTAAAFFPVVPRADPQLRLCFCAGHAADQIQGLAESLATVLRGRGITDRRIS